MATFTLTGKATDLVGDGPTKTLRGYVEPSQPEINDADNNVQRYGNKALTFDTDGAWTIDLTGTGPDTLAAYRVVIDYVDDSLEPTISPSAKLKRRISNYFPLTADTEFGSVVEVDLVAVTTETLESVYDARDEAVAAAEAAEAVGDTNDAIMASRINDPASAARAALNLTFASYINLAKNPDTLVVGNLTYGTDGLLATAAVVWPDGKSGVMTIVSRQASTGAVTGYTITHVDGATTLTYTQPTITRDSSGNATIVPQITVA